jgi:hypothetical protein
VRGPWRLLPALLAAAALAADGGEEVLFRDVTREAGVTFSHHSAPEKKFIVESMSGGVALFDYDNDGWLDIYLVDSLTVDTAADPKAARSALYRNKRDGTFEDVSDAAGVAHPGWGMGVCVADVDGDGWNDLYVTNLGPNRLYRNNRDGTFRDITQSAGVAGGDWSTGCGFADYDRDGDLDLFVSRYVRVDLDHLPAFGKGKTCEFRGIAVQCGPRGLPGSTDFFFRNEGDGRFREVAEAIGTSDPKGYFGLGIAWLDVNDDGWIDLYVANDATPSQLYVNLKDGTFKEMGFPMGVAVSDDGAEQAGMGLAIGDYDLSGSFAIFKTHFSSEASGLYHREDDHFVDLAFRSKTAAPGFPYVKFGTCFLDYDNDGWEDLIVVNGHVYPQMDQAQLGEGAGYRQRKLLYRNKRDGTFEEVAARYGPALTTPHAGRGVAIGDLDNDGRIDAVVNNLDGPPEVLHNELATVGHWLIVKVVGKGKNTNALGAVITLKAGGLTQRRLVRSGSSYISQDDFRAHFGLGALTEAEVEVFWPDGTSSRLEKVKADRILEIRQP